MAGAVTRADPSALQRLLDPRAVAVVGATERPGYASRLFRNLVDGGYQRPIHPISRSRDSVFGRPAFRSLADVPGPVDVALVVVPAEDVPGIIDDCGRCGVAVAVVISAGFGEAGEAGHRRRDLLRSAASRTGTLVIGPNGNGYASAPANVWASTFSGLRPREAKPALPVVLLSQSGGSSFGAAHERAQDHGFSFSAVLSTGNEEVIASESLAEELMDLGTRVVALICEDFHDGPALLRAARAGRARGSSIVVLKVGRSAAGRAATATHTAALAADDTVVDGVLCQHGIVRVDDVDQLVQCVRFLATSRSPTGTSAVVLSHSGGLAALSADALGGAGFELSPLSDRVRAELDELLPNLDGRSNPVDVTMNLRQPVVSDVVGALVRGGPDLLQVITAGDPLLPERVAAGAHRAGVDLPALCLVWAGGVRSAPGMELLDAAEVPWFTGSQLAATVLSRCRDAAGRRVAELSGAGTGQLPSVRLDEAAGKRLLRAAGLAVPTGVLATTVEELLAGTAGVPAPWALKVVCPRIVHKAAAGLLVLGLTDEAAVRGAAETLALRARAELPDATFAFLLEHQHDVQAECFVGATIDPHFGPVIGLGRGGADVELDSTVVWATCPLDEQGALDLLADRRLNRWLRARAVTETSQREVAACVAALSRWFLEAPERPQEFEVNPLAIERESGDVVALDAVVRLADNDWKRGSA